MRVKVKNYLYRHFDNMLILQTENDTILYIYCPSECTYDDKFSHYYCYEENIIARQCLEIDYVDYHIESDSNISCDGIAHFIQYDNKNIIIREGYNFYRDRNRELSRDILDKAGGYWHHYNDLSIIESDRKKRQWLGFTVAISNIIKGNH